MAGYISKFATGATIEAILDKANNSQSVSAAEKTTWNNKQNALTFDTTPTENSTNPVTSGGVFNAINSLKADTIPQLMALNDDVNNYRISESISEHSGIRRWVCPSSTIRDSLTNLPGDFPSYPDFEIRFEQFKSNGIGMQTITGGSTSSLYIAKRVYKNNTFSDWNKVIFETDLQNTVGDINTILESVL